ncbi:MAG: DUF5110 domain-containing protein [Bacilli bacterium]|nr:DUF5110 domain-containing protein [Bacilli bacterium]
MYDLGEQFKIDYNKAVSRAKAIIKGQKYRFTVLTPRLIRLEYSEKGSFLDAPTERVLYRNLDVPNFDIKDENGTLVIITEYFKLTYSKEKPFESSKINPYANLKVELLHTDNYWYYGHPEIRNFGAPSGNLDDGKISGKGIFSADGMASIDDSNSYVFNEDGTIKERDAAIDIYLFMYNKDYEKALKDYYEITGYPALIPRYALGNWWSRNDDYDDLSLKELVDNFEKKEIPVSNILLDKDWHKRKKFGKKISQSGFTFDKEHFKNPAAMASYLHSKGIRLGLNINVTDGFLDVDDNYQEALKFLKADKNGSIPFNVFDPKWVDVYLKIFIHPLDNIGIDFFWVDGFDKSKALDYSLLKHYQFYDMQRDYKRRPMVLASDTFIASHRYPVLYSGKTVVSWDTLKKIPFYNASAFNNGVSFWAHDIGGYFKGIEDSELYTRFVQLGTFSPILKFGADKGKYYKREPWRWGIKTYTIVKDYLQLRHKLIPYIYSEAYKYHKYGEALIKPIYLSNMELYDDLIYRNEYYFGSSLLICPIVSSKDYVMDRVVHNFYVPKGTWYDFVTGKKFPGGHNYISFFKDEEYPVFASAGAIIPMGISENLNDTTPPKDMEIQIFPGQSNTYTLFEDDGESDLYRKGFYLKTDIEYNYMPNNYSVIIRSVEGKSGIVPDKRNYKFVFRNTKRTEDVTIYFGNNQVSFKTYVDGEDFIVEVNDVKTVGQLTVNCRGKDIEIDAVRLINRDIEGIISDLQIPTMMKEKIDEILFSDLTIQKKRIEIRKLGKKGLDKKFVKMFIKLLEYISEI